MSEKIMNDKISVIMACYNCEKTVRKSIDSILAQTYTNWVMICCDDGSSDGTLNILNEYKEKYPDKFVIIKNDGNKQLPYSLNHCLEYVETDLVARMDADDWSLPERFEKQVKFLKEHPDISLVGTIAKVFDGNEMVGYINKPEYPDKTSVLSNNPFNHGSIMTYKRVYDELGGYSLDKSAIRVEDVELWFRFFASGYKAYNIQEYLFVYFDDINAHKRRTLKARYNGAIIQCRGYKMLGYKGLVCYKPYFSILKAFVPFKIYQYIHKRKLSKRVNK